MNMTSVLAAAVLSFVVAFPAAGREVAGVSMPEKVTVEGKQLSLNGMGLRSKAIFKVYVAGLYAETGSQNALQMISSDQIKQVRMVMMRDLGKDKIAEAVVEGFEKNNAARMPALRQRLDQFIAQIPDLESGEELVITYIPGKGTMLSTKSGSKTIVPGKDFADAIFSVWLGETPVDTKLKAGMLGS